MQDEVISLCSEGSEPCLAFPRDGENIHWHYSVFPADATLQDYRAVRDTLQLHIEQWLKACSAQT